MLGFNWSGIRKVAMAVPGVLADGRYRVEATIGAPTGRCPWCGRSGPHRQVRARGVLGNGTMLPVTETLLLCLACGGASVRPNLLIRLVGGLGVLALTLFMSVFFGGAVFLGWTLLEGWWRGTTPEPLFLALCLLGFGVTSVGLWVPLRRLNEAVRGGQVRVEVPVEEAA
jgi:hypothetical protein